MAGAPPEKPSGLLVLDKPAGISSARALNAVKARLLRGTKVGHAGTLDPFATGVLVVLVGRATKLCERVMGLPKRYEATLRLGATTETLDPESPEQQVAGAVPPALGEINRVLAGFHGEIQQSPPAHSAIKVGGRRAYDLARSGDFMQLPARKVRIYRVECFGLDWPDLRLAVECGRGFYVRSFARDIGEALGTGAYLKALRRTHVGPFAREMAVNLADGGPLPLLPEQWLEERT